MSDRPPSSQASSASGDAPEQRLRQGLAALKRADYAAAIDRLSTLSQDATASSTQRTKARIGLVKALKNDGQVAQAIAQCQSLVTHSQTKVQQWAQTTLTELNQLAQPPSPSPSTAANLSGFRPLDAAAGDVSGFTPLAPDASSPPKAESQSLQPSDSEVFQSEPPPPSTPIGDARNTGAGDDLRDRTASQPSSSTVEPARSAASPEPSLFHYETLNQTTALPSAVTDPPPSPLDTETTEVSPESTATASVNSDAAPWQVDSGDRQSQLRSLPDSPWRPYQLWGTQLLVAIVLFWVCREFVQWVLFQLARGLMSLTWLVRVPVNWRFSDHTLLTLMLLGIFLLSSPWLLDALLSRAYGQKVMTMQTLKQSHPESCRLLRRIGQQRGWLSPALRELPTETPLIFSYGWSPRHGRIVISRGLLNRLDDAEFATVVGYELTHFVQQTLPLMSLVAVLLQGLYQGYWQLARWADRRKGFVQFVAATLAALSYGGYWVIRKVSCPLSRVRASGCDRQTTEWTGNPNAWARTLLKLEAGIAETIAAEGGTPALVESTDLLTPYGYEAAISLGSLYGDPVFPQLLKWDTQNPYRHWLTVNSSHPPLGDRLKHLTQYALQWQLGPEVPLPSTTAQVSHRGKETFWSYWIPFLLQIAPYIGPLLGGAIAMGLWFIGGVVEPLGIWQLGWLYGDRSVLWGSLLIGTGIGIMVRINPYFPDISTQNRLNHPTLASLLKNPMALPTDSRPVRLRGQLLGRRGVANWLCQDLILKTPDGLVKVHFLSTLGAISNLFIHARHPARWLGRETEIQGWFRRGAIAWVDIDRLFSNGKLATRGNHPMWSVLLSLSACAYGLYLLFRG